MKCPSCGNEFGNGANCQSCGMDKVTAFAKYDGYSSPKSISGQQQRESQPALSPQSNINDICPFCGEIIPNADYCPYCGKKLTVTCPYPSCGHEYPAKYPCCPKCGTNRVEYNKEQELQEKRRLDAERKKGEAARQEELMRRHKEAKRERERREAEEKPIREEARRRVTEEIERIKKVEGREVNWYERNKLLHEIEPIVRMEFEKRKEEEQKKDDEWNKKWEEWEKNHKNGENEKEKRVEVKNDRGGNVLAWILAIFIIVAIISVMFE